MNKKIIDILPPKEIEKKEVKEIPPEKEESPLIKIKKPEIRVPLAGKKGLSLGLIILIFAFIVCYFTLSRAEIEIWPETQTLTLKTKVTIDKEAEKPNFLTKVIPGNFLEKEKTITKNFPATGKTLKEKKAEGSIRVYNEYSTYSQVLVATTRFVSAEGKLFRTLERVIIPGGHYEGGKFIPGEIDIKVVADQAGPDYNIDPSTFSIPGFAGTDRYTKFYAKSFQPMTGGFSEEVSQVTKEDLARAEEVLIEKAKEESEVALKDDLESEKFSIEFYYLEKAIQTEILETFSLAKAGDEAENFNFQVKAKSKTLIFKKEDIKNFVKEFISPQVPEEKELYEESLKVDFLPETINLASGKIILSLEISAKIYSDINIPALKENLKGKSLAETKIFLEHQPEIIKVRVEFWPFWVKKVPEDTEKIEFKLRVD
jgi:hypothetical protein